MKKLHIIFDLDGTVLDTEFEVSRITADITLEKGCPISAQDVFCRFAGQSCNDKFSGIARRFHVTLAAEDLALMGRRHSAEKKALFSQDNIPINPHIPELLQELKNAGALISLGSSNISAHSRLGLGKAGLLGYFDSRIYGPDMAEDRKKPDPAIFLLAMKEQNSTKENTIVVEDTEAGILAGHAAGAYVIAYLDPRFGTGALAAEKEQSFKKAGANAVIRSFKDFIKVMPALTTATAVRKNSVNNPAQPRK